MTKPEAYTEEELAEWREAVAPIIRRLRLPKTVGADGLRGVFSADGADALATMLDELLKALSLRDARIEELEKELGRYRRAEASRREGDELQNAIAQRLATPPQTESK